MTRMKGDHSAKIYAATVAEVAREGGSSTFRGEQRIRQGLGLDPLVDPKTHGTRREAMDLMIADGDKFVLKDGIAMPFKRALDTTGSMGDNVDKAFHSMPRDMKYLVQGEYPLLGRYHVQMATGLVQDRGDAHDGSQFGHSEYEPDNEIENQMRLLHPVHSGGDAPEEYQFDMWYTGYRTTTSIRSRGLKGYYFIVGDEMGRDYLATPDIKRFYNVDLQGDIDTVDLGRQVLADWHTFFLQVDDRPRVFDWWERVIGRERVVILPKTEVLAEVQAAIVGLTEGILDLQSLGDFLQGIGQLSQRDVGQITRAVANIPLRAQAEMPGFDKVPAKGSVFASRDDAWPINGISALPIAGTEPIAWRNQL